MTDQPTNDSDWLWFLELLDYLFYQRGWTVPEVERMMAHVKEEQTVPMLFLEKFAEWVNE